MKTPIKAALISIALAAGAASAVPALAQDFGPHGQQFGHGYNSGIVREGYDLFQRIDNLQQRIDRGRMHGDITRSEASRVLGQLTSIKRDLVRTTSDRSPRLSSVEHKRFEDRLQRLSVSVRMANTDGDRGVFHR